MKRKLVFKINKVRITICLICLFLPQMSFSQDICGKWECPDEMYQYWGYKAGKAHITFKNNNTFVLKVKGRSMMGSKFWPHRGMSIKAKGLYTAKNDSIYFYIRQEDIKCHVTAGKEDPAMSPKHNNRFNPVYSPAIVHRKEDNYDYYEKNIKSRTTWDGREVYYDSEVRMCDFQRIAMINQMLDFFELKKYSFKRISQDSLRLGKKFVITRPTD